MKAIMCLSSKKTTIQGYPIIETDFHELPMEEIDSLGFPIDEVNFHGPTLMEQTFTYFILRNSVQLIWNRLNWFPCFFSNQNDSDTISVVGIVFQ